MPAAPADLAELDLADPAHWVQEPPYALFDRTREEAPVHFFAFMGRAATRDVELHGQTIKEGDRVLLWYLASNRDPERFQDPARFDLRRTDVDAHQAFGAGGRHFCLGASLARLELKVWIEETLRRLPDVEPDGEPRRVSSLFLNQYGSIPVRWSR